MEQESTYNISILYMCMFFPLCAGFWAKNEEENKQVMNVTMDKVTMMTNQNNFNGENLYQLQRCDLNTTYLNQM